MKIPREILTSIVFLYPSVNHAENDEDSGGTGFLMSFRTEDPLLDPLRHNYIVTNSHIAYESNCRAVRVNLLGGGTRVFEVTEWVHHPSGDDVAVAAVDGFEDWDMTRIEAEHLLNKAAAETWDLGAGDTAFTLGRYRPLKGLPTNVPVARFGTIAAWPSVPVRHSRRYEQESILVEARSLSGFSGSPVFATLGPHLRSTIEGLRVTAITGSPLWLLGIGWGHHSWNEEVLIPEQWGLNGVATVSGNAGMMLVVPAWKILDLLCCDEMIENRLRAESDLAPEVVSQSLVAGAHRAHALARVDAGDAMERIAEELGISTATIRSWNWRRYPNSLGAPNGDG